MLKSWGRLLRLSLAPSAAADVAAGVVVGAGSWPGGVAPFLLMAGSLCVYHGGLALNDWADRDWDRRTRPERPLPSGAIGASAALSVGLLLLFTGPLLGFSAARSVAAEPGFPAAASVAALGTATLGAVAYDLGPRGPWLGPLLLGLCRGSNLAAGLFLGLALGGDAERAPTGVAACSLYALYVLVVSRLGRLEDGEDAAPLGRRPSAHLRQAAVLFAAVGCLPMVRALMSDVRLPQLLELLPLGLALGGSSGLLTLARREEWRAEDVQRAMGACLRRLLVFTATCALLAESVHGLLVAWGILCGFPISYRLRRAFPPS